MNNKKENRTNKKGVPLNLPRTGTMKLVRKVADEICALKHTCDFKEICEELTTRFDLPKTQLTPKLLSKNLSDVLLGDTVREKELREARVNELIGDKPRIFVNLGYLKEQMRGIPLSQIKSPIAERRATFTPAEPVFDSPRAAASQPAPVAPVVSKPRVESPTPARQARVKPAIELSEKSAIVFKRLMDFIKHNDYSVNENNLESVKKSIESNVEMYSQMLGADIYEKFSSIL